MAAMIAHVLEIDFTQKDELSDYVLVHQMLLLFGRIPLFIIQPLKFDNYKCSYYRKSLINSREK